MHSSMDGNVDIPKHTLTGVLAKKYTLVPGAGGGTGAAIVHKSLVMFILLSWPPLQQLCISHVSCLFCYPGCHAALPSLFPHERPLAAGAHLGHACTILDSFLCRQYSTARIRNKSFTHIEYRAVVFGLKVLVHFPVLTSPNTCLLCIKVWHK